jgi:hypothetical protein
MTWITLPQAPVVAGEAGHPNDHNLIEAGLATLWGAAEQSVFNVQGPPYNATGNGVTDDTVAIQNAINAANTAGGGVVYFPAATYLVTPASTTVAALILNNGTAGHQGVRLVGAGALASKLKRAGPGPILSMSGPSTSSGTTHCKYCSLESIRLDGGAFTGTMLQTYYADDLSFREVYFGNCPDIVQDTAEFWDSRYYNCVWESNGSATANAAAPNVLLRNSAASSGFGASANNTNQIHFVGCRWEHFTTGAVWVQQGVSNAGSPQEIYFTNCKMETGAINGGPHLLTDANCQSVYVDGLYCFSGGFSGGYSTAQDVITWSAQDSALDHVFIATGAAATVANGVTLNSTVAGQQSVARNVTGIYSGAPTGNHIGIGTATGSFVIDNCLSSVAAQAVINAIANWLGSASTINAIASSVAGDTFKRFVMNAGGGMSWGSGGLAADVVATRTAAGVWSWTSGIIDPQHGTKTTTAAAVLTPTLAQGTAAQLTDTTRDYQVYFTVGTPGTVFTVAIGPTSTPANTIVSSNTPNAGESVTFRLPAGWFVKWSGTSTTLATQIAIGC